MTARLLEWDSEFWGFRVGQAESPAADEWAQTNVDVMCLCAPTANPDDAVWAEDLGYRLADVRVRLARQTARVNMTLARGVEDADVDRIAAIARTAHRGTRFYADPSFPNARCDDLYETWLRNSCAGYADEVLVVDSQDAAVGYCTVHLTGRAASIGLIAVAEGQQQKGCGFLLVHDAVDYACRQGASEISVVTQGRNVAAQRLFQAAGFRTTDVSLWYHKDFR